MTTLQETHTAEIEKLLSRYADRRSAVLPMLYIAQDTYGTLTPDVIREVAETLDLPYTDIFEVVGFYTLFYDQPFGKWLIQVCDDVPCCYLGAEELIASLKKKLSIQENETTSDGMFTLQRVKCLAACHRPPVIQANLCYFYDVTVERVDAFLRFLREHTGTSEASSVSGHYAEDYEPGPGGTFRLIERQLGPIVERRAPESVAAQETTTPTTVEQSQAEAEQQAEAESPVAPAPDQSPAAAHPVPEKQDEQGAVPAHAAQQEPPQVQPEHPEPEEQPSPDRLATGAPTTRKRGKPKKPDQPREAGENPPVEGEAQSPLLDRPADESGASSEA